MAAAASNATPNAFTTPVNKTAHAFDKSVLDATLSQRFFFAPAFEIYGGASPQNRSRSA
jgi:glycyl-tRNA synthetase